MACAAETSANPNKANTIVLTIVSSRRFQNSFDGVTVRAARQHVAVQMNPQ
jgi:hypothetical protein